MTVISFDRHPPFFQLDEQVKLVSTGITRGYRSFWKDFWTAPGRLVKLRRYIIETQPHAVISFMDLNNLLTILCTRCLNIPVFVAERSDPAVWPQPQGWRLLRRVLYPLADRIITQSEDAKRYFSIKLQSKIAVIPNPVPAITDIADPAGLPREKMILGVGRLTAMKRFDLLLRAVARLHREFPDWRVDILGEGEELESLRKLSADLGIHHVVRFCGLVRDTRPYLLKASIFMLCSEFEGFPNALSEALAVGLPAISSETTGAKAMIQHGSNGLLVPVGDLDALTASLRGLLANPEKRRVMGQQAQTITQRFSLDAVMNQWEHLLMEVV